MPLHQCGKCEFVCPILYATSTIECNVVWPRNQRKKKKEKKEPKFIYVNHITRGTQRKKLFWDRYGF